MVLKPKSCLCSLCSNNASRVKVFHIRHLPFIAKGEEKELEEETEQEASGSAREKFRSQMFSFPRASFSESQILGVWKQKEIVSSLFCRPTVQSQGNGRAMLRLKF